MKVFDFSPSKRNSAIWISSPSFWNSQFWLRVQLRQSRGWSESINS